MSIDKSKIYSSFRHFDTKGRKVALFGAPLEEGMEIFVLTCSRHDVFKKEFAWQVYEQWQKTPYKVALHQKLYVHPRIEKVEGTKKHEFLRWCDQHFFKEQYYWIALPSPGIVLSERRIGTKQGRHLELKIAAKP